MKKRFFGGSRVLASAFLLLGLLGSSDTYAYLNNSSPLGTNTNEVLEFDSSVPFLDLFKASLPFHEAVPHLTKGRVEYDRHGWPTYISPGGMAGTRVISKLHENAVPRGYYTVLYEGQGELSYGLDAKLVQSQPGRDLIMLDPGKDKEYNVKLTIKSTQRGNHLRNIRILPQGGICSSNPFVRVHNASQCRKKDFLNFEHHYKKIIFNPDYLKFMRDYKVVRFMNMSGVTRNPIRQWSERPKVEDATWGGKEGTRGVPVEVMVELANRLNADPWFNIPHAVNDDYIRRFALYVKQHLNPSLKAYIEYSNETWNGIFTQHAYMKQGGKRLGLHNDPPHVAGWKFYAKRSVDIFKIWEQVFGNDQRLVRVLAGLTGTTTMTETMLKYKDAYKYTDAFAIAPYVFGDYKALRRARSVNQVFQIMQDKQYSHSLPRVLEAIRKQSAMTRKYGVDLIAYEGGQHLIDDKTKRDDQHPNPLFYKANRHQQMNTIYKKLLVGWKQAGGKMFVHFSSPRQYNRFGSKGTKEYITQPDSQAPKHLALQSFIKGNPCWWQGCRGTGKPSKPQFHSTSELAKKEQQGQRQQQTKPAAPKQTTQARQPQAAPQVPVAGSMKQPHQIPQAGSMKQQATRPTTTVRKPQPQPDFEDDLMIPELASDFSAQNPQSSYTPPAHQPNIPPLEPILNRPGQKFEPILVAFNRPPNEQYVFGDKAVANYAQNSHQPFANASTYQLRRIVSGKINGAQDLAAVWQTSWDQQSLHLRIAVRDDVFKRDSRYSWQDDSIEIFIDADASKQRQYDRFNDFHMLYRWRDKRLILGSNSQPIGAAHTTQHIAGHYVLDISVPWSVMHVRPRIGHRIGIDVHVNDDDNGGEREGKLTWHGKVDEAYRNPSVLGELVLR